MLIYTQSGIEVNLRDPKPEMFDPSDMAYALSMLCRFTGHTARFYSVLEHSCVGSLYVPGPLNLEFMLHDAAEAYTGDLATPLKKELGDYIEIQDRIDRCIRERFGLPSTPSPEVKAMDLRMLATEKRDLIPPTPPWPCLEGVEPIEVDLSTPFANNGYMIELFLGACHASS